MTAKAPAHSEQTSNKTSPNTKKICSFFWQIPWWSYFLTPSHLFLCENSVHLTGKLTQQILLNFVDEDFYKMRLDTFKSLWSPFTWDGPVADWSGPSHLLAVVPCGGSYHEHARECRSHHLTSICEKEWQEELKAQIKGTSWDSQKHPVSQQWILTT